MFYEQKHKITLTYTKKKENPYEEAIETEAFEVAIECGSWDEVCTVLNCGIKFETNAESGVIIKRNVQ